MQPFLTEHASEVENMLFTEWDWNEAMKIEREEALEEGLTQGRAEGRKEIILSLLDSLNAEQIASMLKMPISEVQQIIGTVAPQ